MARIEVTTQHIVSLLRDEGLLVQDIAAQLGVTRQAIWKRLKHFGIDSRVHKHKDMECAFCGVKFRKRVKLARFRNFCKAEHYYAFRENSSFVEWRHGSRLARAIVAQHFDIDKDHIVHHKDGNERNNDRGNLMVFANQSDHIAYHHGRRKVEPLWDGAVS